MEVLRHSTKFKFPVGRGHRNLISCVTNRGACYSEARSVMLKGELAFKTVHRILRHMDLNLRHTDCNSLSESNEM